MVLRRDLAAILPVVTTLPPFLSCLLAPAARSICREVRLVSKLLGRPRKDLDRLLLLLLLGLATTAGGCMELAELGAAEPRAEEVDLTLLGAWDRTGEKMLRR